MIPCPKPVKHNPLAVTVFPDGREVCGNCLRGKAEYMARKMEMAMRQGWLCALCGLWMNRDEVTFEHDRGRGLGGGKRDDRTMIDGKWHNAAAHFHCNNDKGSRSVPYVITQETISNVQS